MGLLDWLFGRAKSNIDWDEIKKIGTIYPENSITLLMLNTGTGWVDKGYRTYAYKEFCPYNFLIMVDFTDSIAEDNPDLDMGTVEDFFVEELRKVCVAHIVARTVTDKGMDIEMYLELEDPAMEHLQQILNDPNRLVSFSCEVNTDPKWRAVSQLMKV